MRNFKITNQRETSTLLLSGRLRHYRVRCDFVPLEQPEFVDTMNRVYGMDQIKKHGDGGCTIYFTTTTRQEESLVDDIDTIFQEQYRERIM